MPAAAALLLLAAPLCPPQDEAPEPPAGRPLIFRVDRIETLAGEPIENGFLQVRDGVIEKIGDVLVVPEGAVVHDLRGDGSTILPPLVLARAGFLIHSTRGGGRNGRFRAIDSLWLEEGELHDLLAEGILIVAIDPPGDGIPGRTSVLATDVEGHRPEALVEDLHLRLRMEGGLRGAKDLMRKAIADAEKAIEKEKEARAAWEKARAEWEARQKAEAEQKKQQEQKQGQEQGSGGRSEPSARGRGSAQEPPPGQDGGRNGGKEEEQEPPKEFQPPKIDPNLVPVVEWLRRERVAWVSFDKPAAVLHWLDLLGDRDPAWSAILGGGSRFSRFAGNFMEVRDALAAAGVRVLLPAVLPNLPYTRIPTHPAAELDQAGVEIVLLPPRGDLEGVRSFRLALADLVREGLDRRIALEAVTLRPAAALGQEEIVRPLEVGAPANFIVFDGDVLDPTAEVQYVLHDGRVVFDRSLEEEEE
ncbi:MAG: hypothetical protein D6702_11540 [Planctomycetota bacterium]|nr:MAG: hypothetical protein D6702_11540 [Planctomycetota bacterium]